MDDEFSVKYESLKSETLQELEDLLLLLRERVAKLPEPWYEFDERVRQINLRWIIAIENEILERSLGLK